MCCRRITPVAARRSTTILIYSAALQLLPEGRLFSRAHSCCRLAPAYGLWRLYHISGARAAHSGPVYCRAINAHRVTTHTGCPGAVALVHMIYLHRLVRYRRYLLSPWPVVISYLRAIIPVVVVDESSLAYIPAVI